MKLITKYMAAAAVAVTAVSCSDFLDMTPTDSVSDKVIWENTENAEMAVNYLYSYTYDSVCCGSDRVSHRHDEVRFVQL